MFFTPRISTANPVARQMAAVMADRMPLTGCVRDADFIAAGIERKDIDVHFSAASRLYRQQRRRRAAH
ncbi:hypothetical protein HDIA_1962 [Hartmannibacter diazotrophicus]|uniref:Uncharacterized protein n=1 Tax=Hartmannibacter diazotrophicus TaxID=1482074 RepID=A0A2C9D5J1_9HYPH|nr:hypothetical protein [Hartmannibacter diazotrophicus]SON55503.1 hypothetical protein HDIA_1962 [Hartmannibacter diazotrophicus]